MAEPKSVANVKDGDDKKTEKKTELKAPPKKEISRAAERQAQLKGKETVFVRSIIPKRPDDGEKIVMRQGDVVVSSTTEWTEVEDTPAVREEIRKERLELKSGGGDE